MIRNSPGPFTFQKRPSMNTTPRSYSRRIFTAEMTRRTSRRTTTARAISWIIVHLHSLSSTPSQVEGTAIDGHSVAPRLTRSAEGRQVQLPVGFEGKGIGGFDPTLF